MDRMPNTRISRALSGLALAGAFVPVAAATLEFEFDPGDFPIAPEINTIDNEFWPLMPGTRFVYAAEGEDGCEINMVTVTSDIKDDFELPYQSIAALAVQDREWLSPECDDNYVLMETTTDWYAQDHAGNVWYLGEDTLAYDEDADCLSAAGAWQAGSEEAEAGVVMLGAPRQGLAYRQEFLEGEAEDMARVLRFDATVALESFGPFTDCLVTKEWTPLERGSVEHKFYCPSAGGLMLIHELHGGTVRVEYIGDTLPAGDFPGQLPQADICPQE